MGTPPVGAGVVACGLAPVRGGVAGATALLGCARAVEAAADTGERRRLVGAELDGEFSVGVGPAASAASAAARDGEFNWLAATDDGRGDADEASCAAANCLAARLDGDRLGDAAGATLAS